MRQRAHWLARCFAEIGGTEIGGPMFGNARSRRRNLCSNAHRQRSSAQRIFMPQNILLILSDPTAAKSIQQALIYSDDGPFKVDWVRTHAEGLERLTRLGKQQGTAPDGIAAVLVDLFLPDSEGIETFDRLFSVAPQIPFLILVTSRGKAIAK